MHEIPVNLGNRSYQVLLGSDTAHKFPRHLRELFPSSTFALVTNDTIDALYQPLLGEWMQELNYVKHVLPDGEKYKTVESWAKIIDTMLTGRLERSSIAIAFGGGVVGDMTGFAAACCLRGIRYVQVPTTLLAMVDSSVGGKTGVDHACGKNLIGAFHQPMLVWADTFFLSTLPDREFFAGYAEMYKCGFLGGRDMFDFIKSNHAAILTKKPDAVMNAIRRSIEIKAAIVAEDEHESGNRALLNFGHTFGHALEKVCNFQTILHGEAIWWGMWCACELGKRLEVIPSSSQKDYDIMIRHLLPIKLPFKPLRDDLYDAMFSDKKVKGGRLRLVLPSVPGASIIRADIHEDAIKLVLSDAIDRL